MIRLAAVALVLFSLSCSEKTKESYPEAHALLDRYILAFRQLAMQGNGTQFIAEEIPGKTPRAGEVAPYLRTKSKHLISHQLSEFIPFWRTALFAQITFLKNNTTKSYE
ncbi:MAG: hypothetical protein JRJ87_06585 [Deltaproteobacteria bacterium]|nr:hypothetical protein [Deltaproteobacteria bacterium]